MFKTLLFAAMPLAMALPLQAEGLTPLRQAVLSAELYALGSDSNDALLILAAAQMRKALDMQPLDSLGPATPEAPDATPVSWQAMIETALALVPEQDPLRGLAQDIAEAGFKGVISGPVYRIEPLAPGAEIRHADLSFRGGEYAEVYAEATSGGDLNLSVYDAQGLLVCADADPSFVAYCGWTPAEDGHFTLVLRNPGTAPTQFALMTN